MLASNLRFIEDMTTAYLTKLIFSGKYDLLETSFKNGTPVVIKVVDDEGNEIVRLAK